MQSASAYSQRQVARNPSNDALALFNQGTSLLRSNQNQEAAAKLERACTLSPNFAEAHHEWAVALLKLDRANEAIDQFNQA
ncbi:MAG: acetylglucosamine transferase, partial [Candidatus Melainabacteria bacterium]